MSKSNLTRKIKQETTCVCVCYDDGTLPLCNKVTVANSDLFFTRYPGPRTIRSIKLMIKSSKIQPHLTHQI